DFPTASAFQSTRQYIDAFVTKLSPDGATLLYSTYLGGSYSDSGVAIAVDGSGSAVVTGVTRSSDFPTLNAMQPAYGGAGDCFADACRDAFVTKLNPDGNGLVFSTYLGGGGDEEAHAIALDSAGSAHVTGWTRSDNFP